MNRGLHPMERKAMSVLVNWLNTSLALLLMGLTVLAATSVSAADIKAWEASINSQTKERYIPVELWAGAAWDGKTELKMPPVDSTYHHRRAQYEIKGPMEWTHPLMGQTFVVYERINPGRDGVKLQRFTINQEKSGLGRVYDARPGPRHANVFRRAQVSVRAVERRRDEKVSVQAL